jgi:hypothetical protein
MREAHEGMSDSDREAATKCSRSVAQPPIASLLAADAPNYPLEKQEN